MTELTLKWVLINKFCSESGYTDKAVRRKIEGGIWLKGIHWRKAPDGRIMINREAFERWVESTAA